MLGMCAAPQRDHLWMLEQQHRVADAACCTRRVQPFLQLETRPILATSNKIARKLAFAHSGVCTPVARNSSRSISMRSVKVPAMSGSNCVPDIAGTFTERIEMLREELRATGVQTPE